MSQKANKSIDFSALVGIDNNKKQLTVQSIYRKYKKKPKELLPYLSHYDWKIRYEIFKILLSFGDSLVPDLIEHIECQSDDEFYWVCRLISHYKNSKISRVLVKKLSDETLNINRKKIIIDALSNMRDDLSVKVLVSTFDSDHWALRKKASDALLKRQNKRTLKILLNYNISSENTEYWIANTLYQMDKYHNESAEFFKKTFLSQNNEVIKLTLAYFDRYKNFEILDSIISLLNHEMWSIRRMAAEILCEYGIEILPKLEILLTKPISKEEKYWISRIIGELPVEPDKLSKIMEGLLNESSPYIRSCAIQCIGKTGNKESIEKILRFVNDSNVEVRKNLAIALSNCDSSKKVEETLKILMDDPDEWVRGYARNRF